MRKSSRSAERTKLITQARSAFIPATCDICVIGGGASGLVSAITAAEAGASVVVIEQDLSCGRTILVTGNGRCNFANVFLSPKHYNDPAFVKSVCGKRWLDDVLDFWRDCGLRWCLEGERLYPLSRQASSIRNVLLSRAHRAGVIFACGRLVTELYELRNDKNALFRIGWNASTDLTTSTAKTADAGRTGTASWSSAESGRTGTVGRTSAESGRTGTVGRTSAESGRTAISMSAEAKAGIPAGSLTAKAVILATGGDTVTELATPFGLEIVPERPALAPLACEKSPLALLNGRRAHVSATLWRNHGPLLRERGEVLLRDYGLSGIVIFDLSRHAKSNDVVTLDLLADMRASEIRSVVDPYEKGSIIDGSWDGLLDPVIAAALVRLARKHWTFPYDPHAELFARTSRISDTETMLSLVKSLPFRVRGLAHPELAQIMCGGIATNCFCPATLVTRKVAGLYACGEAIDVDGDCGGFNLAWAWKSGMVAGLSAATACQSH